MPAPAMGEVTLFTIGLYFLVAWLDDAAARSSDLGFKEEEDGARFSSCIVEELPVDGRFTVKPSCDGKRMCVCVCVCAR